MAKRIQSPSSINLYRQCPRKYFYQYILRLPTKPSIHTLRGSIVHEVLEKFFSINIKDIDKSDYIFGFKSYISAHLFKLWRENLAEFSKLNIPSDQMEQFLVDSQSMLTKFIDNFSKKFEIKIKELGDFEKAFRDITPGVEEEITIIDLGIRGYIDTIHEEDGHIIIMDYKTSNKDDLTEDYKLQLAIYALLYYSKHSRKPTKVGINFLKFGEKIISVNDELIDYARKEVSIIHEKTVSDHIADYPRKESPLCKWSTGKCDFYEFCMEQKKLG